MKGDFTRNSFDKNKHYSQVLMQQGRVQLDADWNEQSSILQHQFRSFVRDLVGPAWAVQDGFAVSVAEDTPNTKNDLLIAPGRFYVDGIVCDNDGDLRYSEQPGYVEAANKWNPKSGYLVYLDVWEQLVTYMEDPAIREVALGGPDTTVRVQVRWQVRMLAVDPANGTVAGCRDARDKLTAGLARGSLPRLAAWAKKDVADDHCAVNPDSAYRGHENQLYRVEIHDPGVLANGDKPSFKWSRENGSVLFPLLEAVAPTGEESFTVTLAHLGRDEHLGLKVNDWVELVTDTYVVLNQHEALLKVKAIDVDEGTVTLGGKSTLSTGSARYAFLRRWDQRRDVSDRGVVLVKEASATAGAAITLEDGVTIEFKADGDYRTGDYWLIPARVATGDVEWPAADAAGLVPALPAREVEHHYALLGVLSQPAGTRKWAVQSCRCALPANFMVCPD